MADRRELVCLGAVAGAFGVKGEVRLKSFCAEPAAIASYGPLLTEDGKRSFEVALARPLQGAFAARLSGIATREAAAALKGIRLYAPRERLPALAEDEFYHADLIGLPVFDPGGAPLGTVAAMHDHGAGDLLELRRPGGDTVLLPFTRAAVPTVDLAAGRLIADPPEGSFAETVATEPRFECVLVIGGTGMLAAASRWLAERSERMTLMARNPGPLAAELGAAAVPLDWSDRTAALELLESFKRDTAPPDLLVTWLHDDAVWLAAPAESGLPPGGRSVRVHGARSADPEIQRRRDPSPRQDVNRQTVILGWQPDPTRAGGRRWLSEAEISEGVIFAIRTPAEKRIVVGTVDDR